MDPISEPISSHALLVLLMQLTALLVLARVFAEGARRFGQPAVIGELLAGVLLGPTILGRLAPELSFFLFPPDQAQYHLLEVISWIGMVLLLLLTGIETDVRVMAHLGRASSFASIFGMVVPFASGLAVGWVLPDQFLADPAQRGVFAAFLATAMAISALPVIARILIDLDLISRNVGVVTLSAAVVDDTIGWLILSVIAGIAASSEQLLREVLLSIASLALFLCAIRWIGYPVLNRTIRYVNERVGLAGADLTVVLAFTFLAAAATEAIGVHAVFGAFVAGLVIRQLPRIRASSLHTLELFVFSALSPVFFAFVGLKVDLYTLSGWQMPVLILSLAIAGKMVGCYVGGRLGRLGHWESVALGFGMNARGAMGLIVALIGLSLGLLTQEMFATIVLVAVVTSFMAPVTLRWVLPRIPLTPVEQKRLRDVGKQRLLPERPLRMLVPTAGGANAMGSFELAAMLGKHDRGEVTALYIEDPHRSKHRMRRRRSLAGRNLPSHLERARSLVESAGVRFDVRSVTAEDVGEAILVEASRDYDLLLLGSAADAGLHDPTARHVVSEAELPVAIVRRNPASDAPFQRVLVPVDGSVLSRYAAEFAFRYAAGSSADITLCHVLDGGRHDPTRVSSERKTAFALLSERTLQAREQLERTLGPLAALWDVTFTTRIHASDAPGETIIAEASSGYYDLLVTGAENRVFDVPLFYGQGTGEVVERAACTTVVIMPPQK
jgi:Kef-type K+ transport system membrane component KefB/nucleotide-binding universal stress UspA family protein